jgi:hypothetical protein
VATITLNVHPGSNDGWMTSPSRCFITAATINPPMTHRPKTNQRADQSNCSRFGQHKPKDAALAATEHAQHGDLSAAAVPSSCTARA